MNSLEQAQEEQLVRQAQAGDTEAFAALVAAHQHFCYNLALQSLADTREAEDVTQEAFLRAWLALPRFRHQARFRTWLYRIVTNLCYTHLPRLRRNLEALAEDELADVPSEPFDNPLANLQVEERRACLHAQIDRLPESQRLIVLLRYREELSYEEIADALDIPLGTVKIGLFRARQRLRAALLEFENGCLPTPAVPAPAGDWSGR